jgi:hypothetical protein
MAAVFDLIEAPPRVVFISAPSSDEVLPVPGGGSTVLNCAVGAPIPPQLEQIMREAYQTPFATDLLQTTQ